MSGLRLYGYWRSSSSWRVRIALELKKLAYENIPVHLVRAGGEQHQDEYQARNPMRQVPLLEWEEAGQPRRLSQSLAIIHWLDAQHPEPPLYPAEPYARARALELAELVNAGIQPVQNLSVLQAVDGLGGDRLEWGASANERGLNALELRSQEGQGQFLVGNQPTIAEICLIPQLYNARRFKVDLSAFPRLLEIEARCAGLEAFRRAHPDRQPDAIVS